MEKCPYQLECPYHIGNECKYEQYEQLERESAAMEERYPELPDRACSK